MSSRTLAAATVLAALSCRVDEASTKAPEADFFGPSLRFEGEWFGEVDGRPGVLRIERLGRTRLRGVYESDDRSRVLVLLIELAPSTDGFANVAPFTWQDGRGGRGRGWLRINRENTALDGAYGYDRRVDGAGAWLFVRVE